MPRRCEVSIESPVVDVGGSTVVIDPCVDTVDTDCVDENGAVVVDVDEFTGCDSLDDSSVAAFING